jgi:hypothetical protein
VRLARQYRETLVVGVDTNAAAMAERSRKCDLPNAMFLVADAQEVVCALYGRVLEVRITLPWGSLLRSVAEGERAFALAVAGAL